MEFLLECPDEGLRILISKVCSDIHNGSVRVPEHILCLPDPDDPLPVIKTLPRIGLNEPRAIRRGEPKMIGDLIECHGCDILLDIAHDLKVILSTSLVINQTRFHRILELPHRVRDEISQ